MKKPMLPLNYALSQSSYTEQLGESVASLCPKSCVLFLKGVLGSGKTTFSRGFIQQLTKAKRVKSPSYTIVESYTTLLGCIIHLDLYRLSNPLELEGIGIRDYLQTPAIWLIEWPEKAMECGVFLLPPADVIIQFFLLPDRHDLILTPNTTKGEQLLETLAILDPKVVV